MIIFNRPKLKWVILCMFCSSYSCENSNSVISNRIPPCEESTKYSEDIIYNDDLGLYDYSTNSTRVFLIQKDKHGTKWATPKSYSFRFKFLPEKDLIIVYRNGKVYRKHENLELKSESKTSYSCLGNQRRETFSSWAIAKKNGNRILRVQKDRFSNGLKFYYSPKKGTTYTHNDNTSDFIPWDS